MLPKNGFRFSGKSMRKKNNVSQVMILTLVNGWPEL